MSAQRSEWETLGASISPAFSLIDYAYHRWWEDKPLEKILPQEVSIPRVDEGAPIPMFYGRVRVRAPILAWTGTPSRDLGNDLNGWSAGSEFYRMDMLYVVGIPMADGNGTTKMYSMWAGDRKFGGATEAAVKETPLTWEIDPSSGTESTDRGLIGQQVVFYDGNPAQDPGAGTMGSVQGIHGVDVFEVPAYFGYLTAVLYNSDSDGWMIGSSPNVAAYSFEVSSYYSGGSYPAAGSDAAIGYDCNPVNILWDLLVCKLGKLGIPASYLDKPSFQSAGTTLKSESFGLSFCFESSQTADEIIKEILRHIDGCIDEDPSTGKLVLLLVRPVDPATLLHITKDNCDRLTNFVASGFADLPSSLRLAFTDRARDYADNSVPIPNQGNAIQQAETEEAAVEFRGITELALATRIADRESQARFRPIIKCSVLVGREFLRVVRGQAVKLTWTGPDISGVVFRVADVDRGTIGDGKIRLDLISDYFYSARGEVQQPLLDRANLHGNLEDLFSFTT